MSKRSDNLQEKYMDGEVLFRKYFELGDAASFVRLRAFAISKGMVSSSGDEPTTMGLWKAMWRWASLKENKEHAWQIYQATHPNVSREEWDMLMLDRIKKAWQYRTNSRYEKFLKDNGWI